MNNKMNKYRTLFLSALQLSTFTFGGGVVIIPLMRKKFVEKLHWIDEQEMMDYTAIAQSSPGAIAVNAAILVGYRVAGIAGALIAVLGTVLPKIQHHLDRRAGGGLAIGAVLFSNEYGLLGETEGARQMME